MTTKYNFPPNRIGESKYAVMSDTENGITAKASGNQTTATKLTCQSNYVTTVASGNDSVALPKIVGTPGIFGSVGTVVFVANAGGNSMQVFGVTPDTINAIATGTGVAVASGVNVWFVAVGYTASTGVGLWRMTNSQAAAVAAITSGTIAGVTIDNSVIGGGTPAAGTFTTIAGTSLTGTASTMPLAGLAATQGGAISVTGGASSTSANAGGAVTLLGGAGGLTGVGGAVNITGSIGGATSGNGGAVVIAGGAGTAGTATGGAASLTGGIGSTGATTVPGGVGGAASLVSGAGGAKGGTGAAAGGAAGAVAITGGVGGATASSGTDAGGAGSTITLTAGNGGAATAGTGNGGQAGSVVLVGGTGGATTGGTAGVNGQVFVRSRLLRTFTVAAKTTATTLTAAEIIGGMITANQGAAGAANYQFPTGTALANLLPSTFTTNDSIDFYAVNISTNAAEIITFTVNTDVAIAGNATLAANNATTTVSWAQFRLVMTGAHAFTAYRIG